MDSVSEGQMTPALARHVERVRTLPSLFVAVGGRENQEDVGTLRDRHVTDASVPGGDSLRHLHRRLEPQHLFYGVLNSLSILRERSPLFRVEAQEKQGIPDRARRR